MRFKLDENLPAELRDDLRALGHEADTVYYVDESLGGSADPVILGRVHSEGRALLTMDKGIADVRAYPPDQYGGIILFRPSSSVRGAVLAFVRRHLAAILEADLAGHLLIVTDRNIRIR